MKRICLFPNVTNASSGAEIEAFPHWATLLMCSLFAILYGVWILPHTVFLRLLCMTVGGLLGLAAIYRYRSLFWQKNAFSIALIFLLLVWVTIHLFLIGKDFAGQSLEYTKIWKKIGLSIPFALGLGLAVGGNFINENKCRRYWQIIFLGLCLPTLIYFVKYSYAKFAIAYGYPIPNYLLLVPYGVGENPFGIARAWYVFFCLPAFAISLGLVIQLVRENNFNFFKSWPYLTMLLLTVVLFFIEADRLGMVYVGMLLVLAFGIIFGKYVQNLGWKKVAGLLFIASTCAWLIFLSAAKNHQWKTLIADSKVAIQVDRYDHWKNRNKGYPTNELGQTPVDSNYSRIAWAIVGTRLLVENPLGYGLMSISFASLGKNKWPDSELSWTHSAWLDFALGYGFPGLILLGLAVLITWRQSKALPPPWVEIGRWGLIAMALVMTTKEVSGEAVINALIFLIILLSSMSLAQSVNTRLKN